MRNVSLKEIEQELHKIQSLSMAVRFNRHAEGMLVFSGVAHDIKHEFSFNADDTVIGEMFASDILQIENISFLVHSTFLRNGKEWKMEKSVMYNPKALFNAPPLAC